ncbi:MAG: hypothetical protein GEU88_14755 [Solirubrobacterales bacterium]|nr:hypothetical protein [Solirubrobacterales bacterium]
MASREEPAGDGLPPVVRGLLDPEAYPDRPPSVELIPTEVSWVLLAGERAYKVKKPLKTTWLDYSTPAKRARWCRREVELNRTLAPDLYLGVAPIVEVDGRPRLGARGRAVEHAVVMRRLPAEEMMPALLARGEIAPAEMRQLAARVAEFHAGAPGGPSVARYGSPAAIRHRIDDCMAAAEPLIGATLDADTHAQLVAWMRGWIEEHARLLRARARRGRVRDGHGDLHAENICRVDGEFVLFDRIEFSRALRCLDVAAEIAALACDLDGSGDAGLAAEFVDGYVDDSGDEGVRDLLPFYCCYRSAVLGVIWAITAQDRSLDAGSRAAREAGARNAFALARYAYAGGAPRPLLVLAAGRRAGSELPGALARRLGLVRPGLEDRPAAALDDTRRLLRRGASVLLDGSVDALRAVVLAEELAIPCLVVESGAEPSTPQRGEHRVAVPDGGELESAVEGVVAAAAGI